MVGHALHNDLKALGIAHPRELQRDTARYPPYRKGMGNGSRPQKLAALALQYLGWRIQTGEHSPLEDAVASLLARAGDEPEVDPDDDLLLGNVREELPAPSDADDEDVLGLGFHLG